MKGHFLINVFWGSGGSTSHCQHPLGEDEDIDRGFGLGGKKVRGESFDVGHEERIEGFELDFLGGVGSEEVGGFGGRGGSACDGDGGGSGEMGG